MFDRQSSSPTLPQFKLSPSPKSSANPNPQEKGKRGKLMGRQASAAPGLRVYFDFVPPHEVIRGNDAETFLVELPGFRREQIKVQINNYGKITVSGERQLIDGRWSRFAKEFQVPDYCNASEMSAKSEKGLLYIILPKFSPEAPETKSRAEESDGNRDKQLEEEEEKEEELIDASKDGQKAEQKEKDRIQEPEYAEKVTSDATKHEGGGKLAEKLQNVSGFYSRRQLMLHCILAIAVLVGVGFYLINKLKDSVQIDRYEN